MKIHLYPFRLVFLFWIPCLISTSLFAQEEDSARVMFERGEYNHALVVWSEMIASGNASAALYYNMGLAYSALNQTGQAIMNFEKASRIKPGNAEILEAIKFEREKILDAAIPVKPFFLKVWYQQLVMLFRPGIWAMLGLLLLSVALAQLLFRWKNVLPDWKDQLAQKRIWFAAALLMLILAGLSYTELYRTNEGIIMETCAFHQAPAEESPVIIELGPGEKVVVTDQIGDWLNVYLVNQEAGWVHNNCVEIIRIGSSQR